jgi:EmrB/QacA subfamily drug resistance transporter
MAIVRRGASERLTFAVLAVSASSFTLLQSLVIPVLPTIQEELHTDQATVAWVLTAYLLSASIMTPIMGRVGDIVGKERVFVVTLGALALGSLLSAVAGSIGVMIVARVIQGVGGGVLPLAFGIVRDEFPPEKVAGAVGSIAALTGVGSGLGVVIAGPIVDVLDWHWLFWLPMILTLVAAVAAILFVPESPVRTPGRISWLPAILLSAGLVALLLALSEGTAWGWGSPRVLGLILAAVVLFPSWVVAELHARPPLIDMQMMRRPAVWTNNLVALLVGVGMYASFAFVPEFVQTPPDAGYGFGVSVTESGLILLPSSLLMFVGGIIVGRYANRVGGKLLVVVGSCIAALSMVSFGVAHDYKWEIYLGSGALGLGIGLTFAAMSGLVVAAVPPEQTGVASGMNANIRTIGGSIGSAVMAGIVTAQLQTSGLPKEIGYTVGFVTIGGALLLAAGAALLIPTAQLRHGALTKDEPVHPEMAMVAGGTVVGDKSE